jgi:hypothetical protein
MIVGIAIVLGVAVGFLIWWYIQNQTKKKSEEELETPLIDVVNDTPSIESAPLHGRLVRYLRLTRTTGSDPMKEVALEAYQGSHPHAHTTNYIIVLCGQAPLAMDCRPWIGISQH